MWTAADYEGILQQVIHRFKFERARHLAKLLASILDDALPYLPPDMLVTYVPTASNRVRERGYDHARELAVSFARQRQLDCAGLCIRRGQQRQVGSNRQQRLLQASESYQLKPELDIADQRILIIDDIVTTGATLIATASLLRQAGAARVMAGVVAQKQ